MLGYGLTYSSGPEITIGVHGLAFKLNFTAIFSNFNMSINSGDEFFIKINLFAVAIMLVLADIFGELKHDNAEQTERQEIPIDELRTEL
jgi:hypothetical protein